MALPVHDQTSGTPDEGNSSPAPTPSAEEMQTILPQRMESLAGDTADEQQTILPNSFSNLSAAPPPVEQEPGFPQVPGYRILKELGKGGMGVVYQAEQVKLHRMVALKMIRGGFIERQEQRQRFLIEAEAVARLQHPNIVQIFEVGDVLQPDGSALPFMALEFVAGTSLDNHLQGKPMVPRHAVELIVQLARSMHYAHEQHLIHRDLKPANILLAPLDDRQAKSTVMSDSLLNFKRPVSSLPFVPKITDFGLAKQIDMDSSQTKAGEIMGTPSYMAPEQAAAKPDIGPSADTYALGAILYELLTGRPPFRSFTTLDTILLVLEEEPIPPSSLQPQTPKDVETICLKCLAKTPDKRYLTSAELADDLQRYLNDEPILARPASLGERLWKWAKRRPTTAALILVSILALITFLAGIIYFNQMVRGERDVAIEARKDAQVQRDDARQAKLQADAKATETQRTLDFFAVTTGLQQIDNNELYRGLLWCAKPLQETGPYRQPDTLFRERLGLHLHFAKRPTLQQMFFAKDIINQGVFSPDDRWIALIANDQTVQVYEAATGKPVSPLLKAGREHVSFTADGKSLLIVNETKAQFWDTTTWKPRGQAMVHAGPIRGIKISPDGKLVATASLDGTVRLWSSVDGKPVGQPMKHPHPVNDVAFRPDGKVLACVTGKTDIKGQLRLWSVESQQPVGETITFPDYALLVTFNPQGDLVAGASFDGTVLLGDGSTGAIKKTKFKAGQLPRQILFDPKGKTIATASQDMFVPIWEVETGRQLQTLPHDNNVWGLDYNHDGSTLVSHGEDMTVRIWDVATGKPKLPRLRHRGVITSATFSSTGKQLLVCSDDGSARLWHLDSRQSKPVELDQGRYVWVIAVSADEKLVASGGDDSMVRLWKMPTGEPVGEPLKFPKEVREVIFDPIRNRLAVCGEHAEAMVFDTTTGKLAFPALKHTRRLTSIDYSTDGQWLVTAGLDGHARVWNAETGGLLKTLEHKSPLTNAVFNPDGSMVMTTGVEGTITFWDVATGKHRFPPAKHGQNAISKAAFSPDGAYAGTTSYDFTTMIWNAQTGKQVGSPLQHQYEAVWLDFHPSSKRLATSSYDTTARLWDVETTESLGAPLQHQGWVMHVLFSPDGQMVSTCSRDRSARFWDAENGQALSPPLPHTGRVVSQWMSRDQRHYVTGCMDSKSRIWSVPKETRPTADLIALVELYDGHQLNKLGGLKQLTNAELETSWKQLREKYPDEFKVPTSAK
jgi:WD40 repeat protein/serine/threonine protein kinase